MCQWVADVHCVVGALWNMATVTADPYGRFFALAERVLTAADNVSTDTETPASVLLADVRASFTQAANGLNIPLLFAPATHLATLYSPVDLRTVREQVLRGADTAAFVDAALDHAEQTSGAAAVRSAVDAYLVDVAARTGDDLLLTAAARMITLGQMAPAGTADPAEVTRAAEALLGPVEWVRAQPYLAHVTTV